jgi:hypothetical protein
MYFPGSSWPTRPCARSCGTSAVWCAMPSRGEGFAGSWYSAGHAAAWRPVSRVGRDDCRGGRHCRRGDRPARANVRGPRAPSPGALLRRLTDETFAPNGNGAICRPSPEREQHSTYPRFSRRPRLASIPRAMRVSDRSKGSLSCCGIAAGSRSASVRDAERRDWHRSVRKAPSAQPRPRRPRGLGAIGAVRVLASRRRRVRRTGLFVRLFDPRSHAGRTPAHCSSADGRFHHSRSNGEIYNFRGFACCSSSAPERPRGGSFTRATGDTGWLLLEWLVDASVQAFVRRLEGMFAVRASGTSAS